VYSQKSTAKIFVKNEVYLPLEEWFSVLSNKWTGILLHKLRCFPTVLNTQVSAKQFMSLQ
jgi:hypothetical protein